MKPTHGLFAVTALLSAVPVAMVPSGPKAQAYWARYWAAKSGPTREGTQRPQREAARSMAHAATPRSLMKRARPSDHVRFLFVAGVEGSGHHAWGELFRFCEHFPMAAAEHERRQVGLDPAGARESAGR